MWRHSNGAEHTAPGPQTLLPASQLPQSLLRVFWEHRTHSSLLKTLNESIKDFSMLKKMETLKNKYNKECNAMKGKTMMFSLVSLKKLLTLLHLTDLTHHQLWYQLQSGPNDKPPHYTEGLHLGESHQVQGGFPACLRGCQASLDRKRVLHSTSAQQIFILFMSTLAIHLIPAHSQTIFLALLRKHLHLSEQKFPVGP